MPSDDRVWDAIVLATAPRVTRDKINSRHLEVSRLYVNRKIWWYPVEGRWKAIFTWEASLAFVLGVLLILSSGAMSPPIIASLLKEVGTALLVAVFVWAFFEVASRRQQEERLDARIERITRNVFFGVFRRDLPEGLIDEASLLVLETKVVRKDFIVTYTLSDDTYIGLGGDYVPFVRLRAVAEFALKNIGLDPCTVPVGVGLPNPIQPGMRDKCDVHSISVRRPGRVEEPLDLTKAKVTMREQMADDKKHIGRCIFDCNLQPGEEIRVHADYVMAKELEDTEVLQSLFPSDGLRVTVIDRAPAKRVIRAKSIHRAPVRDSSSPDEMGTYIFGIEHHMLPHQGLMLWWKARLAVPAEIVPSGTRADGQRSQSA